MSFFLLVNQIYVTQGRSVHVSFEPWRVCLENTEAGPDDNFDSWGPQG